MKRLGSLRKLKLVAATKGEELIRVLIVWYCFLTCNSRIRDMVLILT